MQDEQLAAFHEAEIRPGSHISLGSSGGAGGGDGDGGDGGGGKHGRRGDGGGGLAANPQQAVHAYS